MTADAGAEEDALEDVPETATFGVAWVLLMVLGSIVLIGFVWMLLDIFLSVIEAETSEVPAYSADHVDYSVGWLMSLWTLIPVMALGSLVGWGIVRAVAQRGGV